MPSIASSSVFRQLRQAEMLREQKEAHRQQLAELARVQEAKLRAAIDTLRSVGFFSTPSTITPSILHVYASASLVGKVHPLFEVCITSICTLRTGSRVHTCIRFDTFDELIRYTVKEFGQYRTSGIVQTSSTRTFPVPVQTTPVCADDWKFVGQAPILRQPTTYWKPSPKPIVHTPAFDLRSESDFPSL